MLRMYGARAARGASAMRILLRQHGLHDEHRYVRVLYRELADMPRWHPLLLSTARMTSKPRTGSSIGNLAARYASDLSPSEMLGERAQALGELAACQESGNWRKALQILDRLDEAKQVPLDAELYEAAIGASARMGKTDVFSALLHNMRVDNIVPTARTVDFVLQPLIATEAWQEIVELVEEVTAQQVVVSEAALQAVFEACGQSRQSTKARQIVENLCGNAEFVPDASLYAAAIRACGIAKCPDDTMRLLAHMDKLGVEADEEVFEQAIRAHVVKKQFPQMLQLFTMAHERGIQLSESIYASAISVLTDTEQDWQAVQLAQRLESMGVSITTFCLGRIMLARARLGQLDQAMAYWQRIVDEEEPQPHGIKYERLIDALSRTKERELAITIFEFLLARVDPLKIRAVTYAAVVRAYGRMGNAPMALQVFDDFVQNRNQTETKLPRTPAIYLSTLNALSHDTRPPEQTLLDAQRVWDIMMDNVPGVRAPAYASLAGVFASCGDLEALDELLQHAEKMLHDRANRDFGVVSAEDDNESDGETEWSSGDTDVAENELLINGVISGFAKARRDQTEQVLECLETLQQRGVVLGDAIVRSSTDAFVKHKRWDAMIVLLERIDVAMLRNAAKCFGDTISKLLEAEEWPTACRWIDAAHQQQLEPPIRFKREILQRLCELQAKEWQIAYALALETLRVANMAGENIEAVANAIEVCMNASRSDLVVKLFKHMNAILSHQSERMANPSIKIPLRTYKHALRACLRLNRLQLNQSSALETAESIGLEMLARNRKDDLDAEVLSLLISVKAAIGEEMDVVALFEKMEEHGFAPNSFAFKAAIVAYDRVGRVDRVLTIRDALATEHQEVLQESSACVSLIAAAARLRDGEDVSAVETRLRETLEVVPHLKSKQLVLAYIHANRLDKCAEAMDESVPDALFHSILSRLLEGDPDGASPQPSTDRVVLGARMLLQFIAMHGLDRVDPPSLMLKVCRLLLEHEQYQHAEALLDLYDDPNTEVALADLPRSMQQRLMEMRLFVHGEQRQVDALCQLLGTTRPSSVAWSAQHFELAMEYCCKCEGERLPEGATACIQLFQTLRRQFIKPTGAVYHLALRAARALDRLEDTGARILQDVIAEGFTRNLTSELFRLADLGITERLQARAARPKRRGAPTKAERAMASATPRFQVDVVELAELVLFCQLHHIEISPELAAKVLELREYLPTKLANKVKFFSDRYTKRPRKSRATTTAETEATASTSASSPAEE